MTRREQHIAKVQEILERGGASKPFSCHTCGVRVVAFGGTLAEEDGTEHECSGSEDIDGTEEETY